MYGSWTAHTTPEGHWPHYTITPLLRKTRTKWTGSSHAKLSRFETFLRVTYKVVYERRPCGYSYPPKDWEKIKLVLVFETRGLRGTRNEESKSTEAEGNERMEEMWRAQRLSVARTFFVMLLEFGVDSPHEVQELVSEVVEFRQCHRRFRIVASFHGERGGTIGMRSGEDCGVWMIEG